VIGNVRACGKLEKGISRIRMKGNEHYFSDIGSLIPEIYEAKIYQASLRRRKTIDFDK